MNKSEELIACLEGEIAKRDEELAACRVAVENCELFRARIAELEARIVWLECEAQVNAAPVSEAKAQGVVIPPSPYMPGSQPTDFTDYELGEIHGRIAMWEEVKRLNAAPVQQPKCRTCTDSGCDPAFKELVPCPGCAAATVQQVSVPDGYVLAPKVASLEMKNAGWQEIGRQGIDPESCEMQTIYCAMLANAPSPAGVDGLEAVGYVSRDDIKWQGDCTLRLKPYSDYTIPLCRLSDAQAIIDGLRGELKQSDRARMNQFETIGKLQDERDQQAQRIGELEGLLREVRLPDDIGRMDIWTRIDAALSAGKESE